MSCSISSATIACIGRFDQIAASDALAARESDVPISLWQDELGRLRLWAANIGAHQNNQSSLDYRLRDASHIREQIMQLLNALEEWFDDLTEVLDELLSDYGHQKHNEDHNARESAEEDNGFVQTPEVQQIYHGVVETITCLYQMSMVIRRPTQRDRILATQTENVVHFEFSDHQHVTNKFPAAHADIISRFGNAITRRRAGLRYRERHRAKLGQGVDESDAKSSNLSGTLPSEYPGRVDGDESDDGRSQTSYAPSLFTSEDRITVPLPKVLTYLRPFECPYCYFMISIKDRRSWVRHFFQDILPYMCPFNNCPVPNRLYSRQRDWHAHIKSEHFDLANSASNCPLCKELMQPASSKRHLSRHLEELALFALPRPDPQDYEDEDLSENPSDHALDEEPSIDLHRKVDLSTSSDSEDGVVKDAPPEEVQPEGIEEDDTNSAGGGLLGEVNPWRGSLYRENLRNTTNSMQIQTISMRYLDKERLSKLLLDRFGQGNYEMNVRNGVCILQVPQTLSDEDIEECTG